MTFLDKKRLYIAAWSLVAKVSDPFSVQIGVDSSYVDDTFQFKSSRFNKFDVSQEFCETCDHVITKGLQSVPGGRLLEF